MATRSASSASARPTRSSSAASSAPVVMSKRMKRTNSSAAVSALMNKKRKESHGASSTPVSDVSREKSPPPLRQTADLFCHEVLDGDFRAQIRVKCLAKEQNVPEESPEDASLPTCTWEWWRTMERGSQNLFPESEAKPERLSEALSNFGSSQSGVGKSASLGSLTAGSAKRELLRNADVTAKNSRNELESESFPCDWSLKLSAKIRSAQPFDWLVFNSSTKALHTANFARQSDHDKTPEEQFSGGLLHWRHPAHPPPPAMESFLQKANEAPGRASNPTTEWVRQCMEEWSEAFYSLYFMLRSGHCPYFYYQGSNFYVLFKAGADKPALSAFVTSSSATLRKRLEEEGVEFTMPNAPQPRSRLSAGERARLQGELRELESEEGGGVRHTLGLGFVDGTAESILHVSGREATHALFDFLLNLKHDKFLPALLSPVAFERSALVPARYTIKTVRTSGAAAAGGDAGGGAGGWDARGLSHVLEVEGPLLPSGMQRVVSALSRKQGSFAAAFKTDGRTLALNSADPAREVGGARQARAVVCAAEWSGGRLRLSTNALG